MPAGLDWVALCRQSKPLVAAVNGAAVGIGMTMILPFDVIVASEKARFGMLFIKVGLVPELASTHFLVQRIGFGRASEMCLSGRLYSGVEAHAWGLADGVMYLLRALVDRTRKSTLFEKLARADAATLRKAPVVASYSRTVWSNWLATSRPLVIIFRPFLSNAYQD